MKTIQIRVLTSVAFMLVAGAASAQTTNQIMQRNANQQARIEQGVQSGALTNREAAHLERGEARINRAEARALSDGTLSKGERAHITHMQNHESRAIYRQKHDRQVR